MADDKNISGKVEEAAAGKETGFAMREFSYGYNEEHQAIEGSLKGKYGAPATEPEKTHSQAMQEVRDYRNRIRDERYEDQRPDSLTRHFGKNVGLAGMLENMLDHGSAENDSPKAQPPTQNNSFKP